MTIQRADFDSIGETDLQELIDCQVAESLQLDFKLTHYARADADKRELLKDISALANTHGGHLVLGVEETDGVATELTGLTGLDTDAEIVRMEQILRSGLEPPVSGIRIKTITLSSGHPIILLRVPRSWNPPHRVIANRTNRFYIRHSAGVHEPSIEELRMLFTQSTSALDHARRFRDERIQTVCAGEGPHPLVGSGRLFLHIVPSAAFTGMVNLDIEAIHAQHQVFRPIGTSSMNPRFNYHGFINQRGGASNNGYTQIFRNGCLEATKASVVSLRDEQSVIDGIRLEGAIFEMLPQFIEGLRDAGVPPPLIILFTLEGVRDARYAVSQNLRDYEPTLPEDIMKLPECVLEDYGTEADYHQVVQPAFDALWNASGHPAARSFNEDGRWRGV